MTFCYKNRRQVIMTADLATLLSTRSRVLVKVIFQYLPSDQLI